MWWWMWWLQESRYRQRVIIRQTGLLLSKALLGYADIDYG